MSREVWELVEYPSKCTDYNWCSDDLPARKFYLLTESGRSARAALAQEWSDLDHRVRTALEGTER